MADSSGLFVGFIVVISVVFVGILLIVRAATGSMLKWEKEVTRDIKEVDRPELVSKLRAEYSVEPSASTDSDANDGVDNKALNANANLPKLHVPYSDNTKTLVVRHVYPKGRREIETLRFFLKHGLPQSKINNGTYSVIVALAGEPESLPADIHELIQLKKATLFKRENRDLDYGAYIDAMEYVGDKVDAFDYVAFVNGTVTGPLLPKYVQDKDWVGHLARMLDEKTVLAGSSISLFAHAGWKVGEKWGTGIPKHAEISGIPNRKEHRCAPHVQSMVLTMSTKTFRYVQKGGSFFKRVPGDAKRSRDDIIHRFEIGLSAYLLARGLNITSTEPHYDQINFAKVVRDTSYFLKVLSLDPNGGQDHHITRKAVYGTDFGPLDSMFVKYNRDPRPDLDRLMDFAIPV
jgi:hypothetical protein